ncbi:HAUS augmin-like complex subunit 4 [Trinorchestia longiramus]|nr:HAUS augmin-like complex subunit 4 [Trinorchestia longiramus]
MLIDKIFREGVMLQARSPSSALQLEVEARKGVSRCGLHGAYSVAAAGHVLVVIVLSTDALSAQLSQSLPVYVSSDLINDHPKLGQLLECLTEHLTPTAVQTSTQQQLNNATSALNQARLSYMEHAALSHYMTSAVRSSSSPKVLRPLNDAFALAELAVSVKLPFDASKVNEDHVCSGLHSGIDALTLTDVSKASSHSSNTSDFSGYASKSSHTSTIFSSSGSSMHPNKAAAAAHDDCSCREGKKCASFVAALKNKPDKSLDPGTYQLCSRRVLAERASRLSAGSRVPALLAQTTSDSILSAWHKIMPCILPPDEEVCGRAAVSRLLRLSQECTSSARLLHSCSVITHALLLQVDEQLVEYGEILTNLVKKRRLSDLPHHQLLYLCTTLHTQQHKLRCVELQILCSAYSPDVLAGLKSVSRTLQDHTSEAAQEVASLQHQLQPYQQLDPSYLALLDEYKKLKADIEFCTSARK